MRIAPVTLTGPIIRLEPLSSHHAADLHPLATEEVFLYFNNWHVVADPNEFRMMVGEFAAHRDALHFAVVLLETEKAIGATALMDYRAEHRGIEIGASWLGVEHQGTDINTACKLLLLTHAFETLGCERVQLKCDSRNLRSQTAIEKLGATREGTLRNHMICRDGHVRDTVMYSVIRQEWPDVRDKLLARLVPKQP